MPSVSDEWRKYKSAAYNLAIICGQIYHIISEKGQVTVKSGNLFHDSIIRALAEYDSIHICPECGQVIKEEAKCQA